MVCPVRPTSGTVCLPHGFAGYILAFSELFSGNLSLAFPTDIFGIIIANEQAWAAGMPFPKFSYRTVQKDKTVGFGGNSFVGTSS